VILRRLALGGLLFGARLLSAQVTDPIQWSASVEPATASPGSRILLTFRAAIEEGWHLYSTTCPPGPIPTAISLAPSPVARAIKAHQPPPIKNPDPNFNNALLEVYDREAAFLIEVEIPADAPPGPAEITARARYQACSDKTCLRPRTKTASATLMIRPGAPSAALRIPDGYVAARLAQASPPSAPPAAASTPAQFGGAGNAGLGQFLLVAFGFGLAAVFTPCVFPMIPITMSFFLNRQGGSKKDALIQAGLFCLGIIVLFTLLGLVTTAALGPFGVVQLGSNRWVNGFIALVFFAFGLSLLGAFEITLPSGLLTRLDSASRQGGVLGTLLMGLTFALTSFACVGPFMGALLAASVQGDKILPVAGMSSFAAGLASPFFLLALFPSYLQRLPKAGGWLPRVKVVMGFILLAGVFKYLSNVDQVMQLGWLTRDRFLAAWIVLFALAGLYLLGLLRLEGIKPDQPLGVGRLLVAASLLIFAVSLIPGMNCGRLGEIDAYVPACPDGDARAAVGKAGLRWLKNDYRGAIERAKAEGKLVFVNFTGYACTNCHWMKANMFTRAAVEAALEGYILVELYTDGADAASAENQNLQEGKFKTVAIPHYAIIDPAENVLASFVGRTTNEAEFLAFLNAPRQQKAARR